MTIGMGRVISDLPISADGYSAGLNQTEECPFGEDDGDGTVHGGATTINQYSPPA